VIWNTHTGPFSRPCRDAIYLEDGSPGIPVVPPCIPGYFLMTFQVVDPLAFEPPWSNRTSLIVANCL
jgi:hypothetical protein